jgi:bacteriophage N4 adsorption protein B
MFAAAIYCAIGAEDAVFDAIWLLRRILPIRQRLTEAGSNPALQLSPRFAILVPAWQEARVIGSMLEITLRAYQDHDATIFLGSYPNDPKTLEALRPFESENLIVAINRNDGPTSKGDALNVAWQAVLEHERKTRVPFTHIVLHDAEDVVSKGEPGAFGAYADRLEFMQIPVVPTVLQSRRWIAGHYCDEFAESHLKSMVVRDLLKGSIPSAGVGTAIARNLLDRIARQRGGMPFSPDSLTEDYELGLIAADLGANAGFLRVFDKHGDLICVRSRFPDTFFSSVRQKSRWIAGIAFSGWDRMGWTLSPVEIWMRWRDRRTLIDVSAVLCGYIGAIFATPVLILNPKAMFEALGSVGLLLLAISSVFMVWRFAIRAYCTSRVYGWREGFWSIPRVAISNIVAVVATLRAIRVFFRFISTGRIVWDKTEHNYDAGSTA